MSVYIVAEDDYDSGVLAVFSTKTKAEEFMALIGVSRYHHIESHVVDGVPSELYEGKKLFQVSEHMGSGATAYDMTHYAATRRLQGPRIEDAGTIVATGQVVKRFFMDLWADDKDQALKIAKAVRIELLEKQ